MTLCHKSFTVLVRSFEYELTNNIVNLASNLNQIYVKITFPSFMLNFTESTIFPFASFSDNDQLNQYVYHLWNHINSLGRANVVTILKMTFPIYFYFKTFAVYFIQICLNLFQEFY